MPRLTIPEKNAAVYIYIIALPFSVLFAELFYAVGCLVEIVVVHKLYYSVVYEGGELFVDGHSADQLYAVLLTYFLSLGLAEYVYLATAVGTFDV